VGSQPTREAVACTNAWVKDPLHGFPPVRRSAPCEVTKFRRFPGRKSRSFGSEGRPACDLACTFAYRPSRRPASVLALLAFHDPGELLTALATGVRVIGNDEKAGDGVSSAPEASRRRIAGDNEAGRTMSRSAALRGFDGKLMRQPPKLRSVDFADARQPVRPRGPSLANQRAYVKNRVMTRLKMSVAASRSAISICSSTW